MAIASASGDASSVEPRSSSVAARAFADDLFRMGRVAFDGHPRAEAHLSHGRRLRTHRLDAEGDAVRLNRCLFDCGFCVHT
jgi:hypothetical protein